MRETLTLRLKADIVKAAERKARADHRTLTNYIEALIIRDLRDGSSLQVIAPPDIQEYGAVPLPGETKAERTFRDALFHAILETLSKH